MGLKSRALEGAAALWAGMPLTLRRKVLRATNDAFLVGVVGLILDDADRVLLLEHRFRTPWRWGLPGGFIDHGESFEAALARELQEEVGLEIATAPEIIDTELNVEARYVSVTLSARVQGASPALRLAGDAEILGGGFYPPDAVPEATYPYHRALIRRALGGR